MRFLLPWLLTILLGSSTMAADLHRELWVGEWIWADTTHDRQECHFVRVIDVPAGTTVEFALLRITADNFYRVYLDGHFIGQGSDWRGALTEYDITRVLPPGRHVLAVSVVNDFEFGGLLAGLRMRLSDGREIEIPSDASWDLVPEQAPGWPLPTLDPAWKKAKVVRPFEPWLRPRIYAAPVSVPEVISFWQQRWFQVSLIVVSVAASLGGLLLFGMLLLKRQSERVVRRERARIAGDLHDNLGGGLTQLVLLGEAVRRELGDGAGPSGQKLKRLCEHARLMGRDMKETVWLINSQRDTLSELASYLARYAETFFHDTPIRCRFAIDEDLPDSPCGLGVRRNLLLGVKEAFNNALRHSGANEVELIIERRRTQLRIVVRDNGTGFSASAISPGEGLRNLELRAREAGGQLLLRSHPGEGTEVEFLIPLVKPAHWGE